MLVYFSTVFPVSNDIYTLLRQVPKEGSLCIVADVRRTSLNLEKWQKVTDEMTGYRKGKSCEICLVRKGLQR